MDLNSIGIMDSFNLAWKLNLIEKGFANRSILNTYVHERKAVAEQVCGTNCKAAHVAFQLIAYDDIT